ncbi:RNase adapter RapZ [Halioxenophilus aromaticivorans]|uniref:RNase adapter RapZ n=1 Tax=Halioxenophilus aromaticivorans TaxID=1306992 RepID=A0AAV3U6A3_9ALTE
MQLVIISGRSGSGISSALRVLEDAGMTCIDNLPVALLSHLVDTTDDTELRCAVTLDARSNLGQLANFPALYQQLKSQCQSVQVIFLDSRDDILLRRFSETRRKHPLTSVDVGLKDAIIQESELLTPVVDHADLVIDTSNLSLHALRDLIRKAVTGAEHMDLAVQFQSFGFKRGVPAEADLIFDARCLPNPYWVPELRACSGNDDKVIEFLSQEPLVAEMLDDIKTYVRKWLPHYAASNRSYITVAVGCTGGQHRSVYLCNQLAKQFREEPSNPLQTDVLVRHRDLH